MPGLLILGGVAAVSLGVFFMDVLRRSLMEGPEIVVLAAEARGLAPGADVWVAGSPSGRVTQVAFRDPEGPPGERVVIHAILYRTVPQYLGAGTRASIGSASLLAPVVLKLDPGEPSEGRFDPADTLHVPRSETTERLLRLAGAGRRAVDSLRQDLLALTEHMDRGPGTLTALRRDTALAARWSLASDRLHALRAAFGAENSLPARLTRDSLAATLHRSLGRLSALSRESRAASVLDSLADLTVALESVSGRLSDLDAALRSGSGSAGRAVFDDEILRQRQALRARLDSVRAEVWGAPLRWMRFRLF